MHDQDVRPVQHTDAHGFAHARGQRVGPQQRAGRGARGCRGRRCRAGAWPGPSRYLPGLGVLFDQFLGFEGSKEAVDGRLREAEPLGELGDAEPRGSRAERLQDARGAVDGLDRSSPLSGGGHGCVSDHLRQRGEEQRRRGGARILMSRRSGAPGTRHGPSAPASGSSRAILPSAASAARWAACPTSRPARRVPLERLQGRHERVDDRLVALDRGAQALDRVQARAERLQQVLGVEGLGGRRARCPPGGSATEQRPGRATDAVDQGGADARQQFARRGPVHRIEIDDRRREASIHVDAVVGIADRGVELRQVITLRREDIGALADPPPNGGSVQRRMGRRRAVSHQIAPSDRPTSVSTLRTVRHRPVRLCRTRHGSVKRHSVLSHY